MVETTNGPGLNGVYQGRVSEDPDSIEARTDLNDQKARFSAEIAALATAVQGGDLTQRMKADYADTDLSRSAAILNELIMSIGDNLSDFNDAMAALAHGDLHGGMRDKPRGAFGQLQKNFNLALATIRTVLGERGSDQFADKATRFRRMLAGFRSNGVASEIRVSDEESRPIPSPPHDLWLKLADALDGFSA
ncbi:chemotaxis protein [Rhizobium phaseoli]|uniref:Chemotaxis protein n=1 Tax=Rhizobium phaseoli TaxID=396 RepID=A0A7K3UK04_9HYPH|nr:methyl-accepting chemotaxis protein [Rhizobium phaseoli]NEJ74013.1 chemotaxis protein [Rhizobium phaseoli]